MSQDTMNKLAELFELKAKAEYAVEFYTRKGWKTSASKARKRAGGYKAAITRTVQAAS